MKIYNKILVGVVSIGIMATSITGFAYGENNQNGIQVMLDGKPLSFDVDPVIYQDRALVPFRKIFEELDVNVQWNNETRSVIAKSDDVSIELSIDNDVAIINGQEVKLDVPAKIYDDRTMVPVRIVSEALGCTVDWVNSSRTVIIDTDEKLTSKGEFTIRGITMGDSLEELNNRLGEPDRIDASKYGFKWYVYNNDYSKYIQVGVEEGRIVALYSNADIINSSKGIDIGTSRLVVNEEYKEPLANIIKGNTRYEIDTKESDTYLTGNAYTTIFYDIVNGAKVTSVMQIDKDIEEAFDGYYGNRSDALISSYERQIFDITNSLRVREGLKPFAYSEEASDIARAHSIDMATRNFMAHDNPDNKSPFDRMEDGGLEFRAAAENIAGGQPNAIQAHEGWMNSKGHRENILENYEKLGVGVEFGGSYGVYYTENFYSEK